MNIQQHLSVIRKHIKKHKDDTIYTDEYLYDLFKSAVALLNKREADKFRAISDWNYKSYCMKMEKSSVHDCDCAPGCLVPSTIYSVPKPLQSRNRPMLKIFTLGYDEIPLVSLQEAKFSSLDPILVKRMIATIENGKIKIWNGQIDPLIPKAIRVRGLWADVTEWSSIPFCTEEGEETNDTCFDLENDEFPLDENLNLYAYQEVLNQLNLPLQIKSDDTLNTNEEL